MDELFPHIFLSDYVWLDQTGKVVATTTSEQITVENIDCFLSDDYIIRNMSAKIDLDDAKLIF